MSKPDLHEIARLIWRNTYRHDSLMEWWEVKVGTMHYKRVMAAAEEIAAHLKEVSTR